MKSLLLIADPQQTTQLRELLDTAYTLFTAASHDEAREFLQLTRVDVMIAAGDRQGSSSAGLFRQAKILQPHCVTLYIAPPLPTGVVAAEKDMPTSDFLLRCPFGADELHRLLEQALEKQRLIEEITALRGQEANPKQPCQSTDNGNIALSRIGQILRHFAKAFSTNFDLHSTLDLFLEAIGEFLHPSRLSIMVCHPTTRVFEIRAYRGLAPKVAERIRLHAADGLPQWLASEGRIVHRSQVESQLHAQGHLEVNRDMQALKAVVSIPLMASGTLVGILNLGERVTGTSYTDDELEILFSLASHMAVGIQDITLYHAVQSQKVFTEKILRYMSSGVITIGPDEQISLCNHRAAEILGKSWFDVLRKDLRSLPSPLGDMLYETLHDRVSYHHHEVILAAANLPLEVNTYQVFDAHGEVSGSVMVFDDLTFQKLLYEERRRADQFDFLNKIVGRTAHEIKNPLVSIQTFAELLSEHYDDPEFRDHFREVVGHDIHAINGITEKLVSFVSKISYRFAYDDVNKALHQLVDALAPECVTTAASERSGQAAAAVCEAMPSWIELASTETLPPVRVDTEQFHKALMYIAMFLQQGIKEGGRVLVSSGLNPCGRQPYADEQVYITLTGEGCALPPEEMQQLFDPFCMEQSSLVDVGPCVSQKIIEEHGGHLDVRQEKNGDTTFVIALPIAQESVEVDV